MKEGARLIPVSEATVVADPCMGFLLNLRRPS